MRTQVALTAALFVASSASAGVRVIHASPNTPAVDVFVGAADTPSSSVNNRVLQDVPFFTASGYLPVPTGTYFFDVVAPTVGYTPAIDVNQVKIDGSKDYTVLAAGDVSDGVEAFLFVDDNTVVQDKARIRVIHGYEDLTVDVAAAGLGTIIDDFEYGTASTYFELPAGSYTFSLRTSDGKNKIITFPSVDLEAGAVYTAIATGFNGETPGIQLLTDVQPTQASHNNSY